MASEICLKILQQTSPLPKKKKWGWKGMMKNYGRVDG